MALAAHMEERSGSSATRRDPRRTIRLEALGERASGKVAPVMVHNISRNGLLIESDKPMAAGEAFLVDLPNGHGTLARVVWTSERLHGCRFEEPVSDLVLNATELAGTVVRDEPAALQQGGEPFGDRLQRLRKARGLSLSQVAEELGVSKPTVWAWEHGRARPVAERIDALAAALGTSASELLSGADTSELADLLSSSRNRIAELYGIRPEKVRIMIEL